MQRYWLLFWIVMVVHSGVAGASEIYKWVDSNGIVHFSDKPQEGAERINLPKAQTFSAPKIPESDTTSGPEIPSESVDYQRFDIIQPQDQVTIRNTEGYVSILLDVKPKLRLGDKIQLIFDGSPLDEPQPTTVFAMRDINRGSHTIAAQIVNGDGKVTNTTETITIFMQPPRVGMGKLHNGP